MKKKILCLAMAAIMAVGIHTTAFAETLQGGRIQRLQDEQ